MSLVPVRKAVTVACRDGVSVTFEAWATPGELARGGDCDLVGSFADGRRMLLSVPVAMATDTWLDRLCDAVAADPAYRDSLVGRRDAGRGFRVPPAPPRAGPVARLLRKGGAVTDADLAGCRAGRDGWSAMALPALREAAGEGASALVDASMPGGGAADVASALRWLLRGMDPALASRKVAVDASARPRGRR